METNYEIKNNNGHYDLYVDGKFISSGDTEDECLDDYRDYLRSKKNDSQDDINQEFQNKLHNLRKNLLKDEE